MKKTKFLYATILLLSVTAMAWSQTRPFSIEGHRGARGYVPENTIPSFIKALELGADTLELDVVISKDKKVVVSHEPWFSHVISLDSKGRPVTAQTEKDLNIYKMNYSEVKKFDVGSIGNPAYPEQLKMKVAKPLLSEVFRKIAAYVRAKGAPQPRFNIEIKSTPEGDSVFHPGPAKFAELVLAEVRKAKLEKNVILQAFDPRPLQELSLIHI